MARSHPLALGGAVERHADHLAYKLDLLKGDQSFQEMSKQAVVNDLAHGHWHHDDFSQRIRVRLSEYCPRSDEFA